MFKGCLTTILLGVLMFVFVIGIIILVAWGLRYVLEFIPCEVMVYVETGVLLGIFMLIATLIANPKAVIQMLNKYNIT